MNWIKGVAVKLIGKQVSPDEWGVSKAKLTAIIYVLITAVQEISKAYGHPVQVPDLVYKFLEGAGLWAVRDAIKS